MRSHRGQLTLFCMDYICEMSSVGLLSRKAMRQTFYQRGSENGGELWTSSKIRKEYLVAKTLTRQIEGENYSGYDFEWSQTLW